MRWWGDPTDKPGHKQAREYARPTSPANSELYRWREATDAPCSGGARLPTSRVTSRLASTLAPPVRPTKRVSYTGGARLPTSHTYFPVQTKSKTLPLNGQASILAANPFRK